jgi:hypothetical protein
MIQGESKQVLPVPAINLPSRLQGKKLAVLIYHLKNIELEYERRKYSNGVVLFLLRGRFRRYLHKLSVAAGMCRWKPDLQGKRL